MKVVHVSTTDYGGAFKAALRISQSMQACGIESSVLVRSKTNSASPVIECFSNIFGKMFSKIKNFMNLLLSQGEVVSDYFGTNISKKILIMDADIVFLHWVNSFISYKNVEQLINLKKPIVWVMHDMWLFTGGCHCDHNCGRFQNHCGFCPMIKQKKMKDISYKNFCQKNKVMQNQKVTIIGPSKWIIDYAKKSDILKNQDMYRIPNPLNSNIFNELPNKEEIKERYEIDRKKKIIMFGAMNAVGNQNKGLEYLMKALEFVPKLEYSIVVFGNQGKSTLSIQGFDIKYLGMINTEEELASIYNMADVFVAPSQQDNYSNAVLEAASCGVPVTAFHIGGMPDLIEHKKSGYLATFQDAKELAKGICYCAENKVVLGKYARKKVLKTNNYNVIGNQYKELSQQLLDRKRV